MREKIKEEIRDIIEKVLGEKGIIERSFYLSSPYYIGHPEINYFNILQDKVKKLEKLTGFNTDDYEWIEDKKLVKKSK